MLPAEIKRHRFTIEEYHRMAEAGLLSEDDRVELIDGEIVEMTPIGWRHANCVNDLNILLARFAQGRYVVSVQIPLTISEHGYEVVVLANNCPPEAPCWESLRGSS